uniref:Si:ch211-140m22.7 n=1 Tax=Gasterosteus aculeatus aculeatus TaxID=481459 RepID=A0AAQ4Q974_GASAC
MCCITVVDPCPCCWELLRESSPAKKNNIKAVLLESTDCLHRKMAAALLRTGRLGSVKCLLAESWITLSRTPAAVTLSTKSGGSKKSSKKNSSGQMDPIQKLFLDSIREYSTKSQDRLVQQMQSLDDPVHVHCEGWAEQGCSPPNEMRSEHFYHPYQDFFGGAALLLC